MLVLVVAVLLVVPVSAWLEEEMNIAKTVAAVIKDFIENFFIDDYLNCLLSIIDAFILISKNIYFYII